MPGRTTLRPPARNPSENSAYTIAFSLMLYWTESFFVISLVDFLAVPRSDVEVPVRLLDEIVALARVVEPAQARR